MGERVTRLQKFFRGDTEKFRRRLETELAVVKGALPAALTRKSRKGGKNTYSKHHLAEARMMENEPDYMYSDEEDEDVMPQGSANASDRPPKRTSHRDGLCPCGKGLRVRTCDCTVAKAIEIFRYFLDHGEEPPSAKRRLSQDEFVTASISIYQEAMDNAERREAKGGVQPGRRAAGHCNGYQGLSPWPIVILSRRAAEYGPQRSHRFIMEETEGERTNSQGGGYSRSVKD